MYDYICGGETYRFGKGYIHLPVETPASLPSNISVGDETLTLKSSLHVSLVCTKDILATYGEHVADLEEKIVSLFCAFTQNNDVSFIRYTGQFRLVTLDERKTVIALCEVSAIEKFPAFVKERLGIEITAQPTHMTLYTLQPDVGIGINSSAAMEKLAVPFGPPDVLARALGI